MSDPLERVRRAADEAVSALKERDRAMLEARQNGESLRAIAEAAGMSHEQVRRLLSR